MILRWGVFRWLLYGLGMLWTLPNTLIGLLLGGAGMVWGARPHWEPAYHAIVFHHWPWGPGGAMTLGNVIINTGETLGVSCRTYRHSAGLCVEPLVELGRHERAHVYQYMVLGVFFIPIYFLCGGVSHRNCWEQAADSYALSGKGWWAWQRGK